MVFSSLFFLFRYLPVVLALYFIIPVKYRNGFLFLASLFFYAWGEPIYVVLMLFSTVVDYTHGKLVHKYKQQFNMKKAKHVVLSSVCINLLLLGFFKYSDFFITTVNSVSGADIPLLKLALPIGISFYTFQTMSYTIDIYRGEAPVQNNIITFGTYVAMFPQLIAGPIVRYQTIADELNTRKETTERFYLGVTRFVTGLGKKVLLANQIGAVWDSVSTGNLAEMPVMTAWIGAFAYAFQIYFDFSGYSDMAIGLGHMFGFTFPENFNYPYMSKSITEFWRRWHISLGTWFREYVYIPLGGNRKGLKFQIRNICIVWLLTGIWHGAGWNFVLWGAYFGALLLIEKWFLYNWLKDKPAIIGHIYTIFLVLISWMIFANESLSNVVAYIKAMFGFGGGFSDIQSMYLLSENLAVFAILILAATGLPVMFIKKIKLNRSSILSGIFILLVMLLSIAFLVDATYNPFLYFRF